ncbi:MAG: DNA cytosine methyltransferase, partial [Deltaproteobacteria bacterium]|nr:DNA cytosine methyltransferase [Deltaproteobacteria bacterium]
APEPGDAKPAKVRAFLTKYYKGGETGTQGTSQRLSDPMHTIRAKACFGLVTIEGEDYAITDIGMRMLQPHELYAAQGFPPDYKIDPEYNGKPLTKTAQIRMCGNSVVPLAAEAIVRGTLAMGAPTDEKAA